MRILKEPTLRYKFAFIFPFNPAALIFCRELKKKYGWTAFGFEFGSWRFNNLAFVYQIKDYFPNVSIDANMQEDLEKYELEQLETQRRLGVAKKLKESVSSDLVIPGISAHLYPYQKIAVEFFMNSNGRAILADTMGLGKTLAALSYVVYAQKQKTLVICPAGVKYVWEKEVKQWTKLKPLVVDSRSVINAEVIVKNDIFIVNYDILRKFVNEFSTMRWDCVICDEFHYIKNITAQRTKYAKMIASKAPSVLLLSGTPLLSRPVELFNGLNIMDAMTWSNWRDYTIRYCSAYEDRFGWNTRGSSHIDELKERINPYFLRRTKDEVLKELPPKRYIEVPVALDDKVIKEYETAEDDLVDYLRKHKRGVAEKVDKNPQAERLVRLSVLRQLAARGKVYAAEEVINGLLDNNEKIVVFCSYNQPLEKLKETYGDLAVLVTGKVDTKERQKMVEDFQKNKNIKIFLGGIKSAGVGITLTAATNVLFLDYSWVPADHMQAVDRIHRIGQTASSVSIYQLFGLNTIDQKMKELLAKKQLIFDQIFSGVPTEKQLNINIMGDLIQYYAQRNK